MSIRRGLERLEQQGLRRGVLSEPWPAGAEEERIRAYFRGAGPRPPCPPYVDPLQLDSHLRVESCLLQRVRGALHHGEYLANMTEAECREVDELVKVITQWDWAPPWLKESQSGTV